MIHASLMLALAVQFNSASLTGLDPSRSAERDRESAVVYDGAAGDLHVTIPRLNDTGIRIDGRLDDAAWADAAILRGFTQYEPIEGSDASEHTEIRVVLSDEALYLSVRAEDSSAGVRASMTERDGYARSDDYVRFVIDTFNDNRRAYVFMVNPLGVQGDGLWVEGRSGGRGFGDPIDWSPDFLWESAGRVDDQGYSAELRIPLKSIRFQGAESQDWGFQVLRSIQRTGYQDSWAPISSERANKLEQAGTLRALEGLEAGLFMEINPTATGSRQGSLDGDIDGLQHDPIDSDFGLNLAYGLTSNLMLDGTVNPDFSQIEADAGQIAVNERFALFLPEKRAFFLEGTDVFSMPQRLVHTRSIVNPIGAVKLSGKVGGFQVAYLGAVDEVNGGDNPVVNLMRFKRDLGRSSSVGMVYTDRTQPGSEFNRVFGADARLVLGGRYTVSMIAAASADGASGETTNWGSLLSASVARSGRNFTWNTTFEDVGEDFRARSGFIRRTGTTQLGARTGYTWRGARGSLVESWGPFVEANGTWERSGFWAAAGAQEAEVGVGLSASFRNNVGGFLSVKRESFEFDPKYYEDFFSGPIGGPVSPVGQDGDLFSGMHSVSVRSWISSWERARISLGGGWRETPIFWGLVPIDVGESLSGDVGLTFYPTGSLQTELGARHVTIRRKLDGSKFSSATIPRVQSRYQFSRALFVRAIAEYSSQERGDLLDPLTGNPVQTCAPDCSPRTGSLRNDFRLEGLVGYEPSPGTVVFVGYTRQFQDTQAFRFRDARSQADGLFVKLSYRLRM